MFSTLFEAGKPLKGTLLILSLAFCQESSFSEKDFEKLSPIEGTWLHKRTNGDIYEQWSRKNATEFVGTSYKLTGRDTMPLEKVSLYLKGKEIVYAPVAAGQNNEKQVLFRLKSIDGSRFVFENPQHDFPQRIVYDFRSADSLYAHIEGNVNRKSKRINYPYRRIH
nr:DUF6265 family protein [uncultured Dyadobacter sp.]